MVAEERNSSPENRDIGGQEGFPAPNFFPRHAFCLICIRGETRRVNAAYLLMATGNGSTTTFPPSPNLSHTDTGDFYANIVRRAIARCYQEATAKITVRHRTMAGSAASSMPRLGVEIAFPTV